MPFRYEIAALPEDEGGGFVAIAPDLPGCVSNGATVEEALVNLEDAIKCWVAEAQRAEMDVPGLRVTA